MSCIVVAFTCLFSNIVLAAYFIDTRSRESQPAEGRIYPKRLKASYAATVYLTQNEKILSDLLFPAFFAIMAVGIALNNRWKLLSPYKLSKWDGTFSTKRKPPN